MCIDILRNPSKSIADAKKRKSMNKTFLVLIEDAVLFAVASGLIVAKTGFAFLLGSVIAVFLVVLIAVLLFGLVVQVVTTTLGGKGKYFEGLTAAAYSAAPISAGVFIVSLLAFVPLTTGLQIIVLALTFALGFSLFYRAIKELYSTDMITSFVAVSVTILALILAVYASLGLSLFSRIASIAPVV